jgi:hypothetical protein
MLARNDRDRTFYGAAVEMSRVRVHYFHIIVHDCCASPGWDENRLWARAGIDNRDRALSLSLFPSESIVTIRHALDSYVFENDQLMRWPLG